MAKRYLPVDRNQPFLLPPSVQEFVPDDDLSWFLIDAVAAMDTSVFHRRARLGGAGRAGYDPDMLLTLLIYAYCLGQRSSRRIEQLCVRDLGFKVVTGNRVVDHSTIAAFRAEHEADIKVLFTQVLLLCARAGLGQVGLVAVDGTKMAAAASLGSTRERETLAVEYERLAAEVEAMLAAAAATDAAQDALVGPGRRGDELPAALRHKANRLARLKETLRQIDQARAEHDAAATTGQTHRRDKLSKAKRKLEREIGNRDRRAAKESAASRKLPGSRPDFDARIAAAQAELAAAQAEPATTGTDDTLPSAARRGNPTDPDSRILKSQHRWVQGYNGQIAATADQIVIAAEITQDANDVRQATVLMAAASANATHIGMGRIGVVVFDAGYWSEDNLTAPGPDRLIACGKNRTMLADLRATGYTTGDPPPDASPADKMRHRLKTETGAQTYAKRAGTVEPVFGQHKHCRGIDTFTRRGTTAVASEWKLIHATGNLLKLHRHHRHTKQAELDP